MKGMTRDKANRVVREGGGRVSNHVCRSTDYLVAAGSVTTSAKMREAKRLGVKVISETEFMAMV